MLARILIGEAEVPGGGKLRLIRRGSELSIMLGANELMNSRLVGSEEALARLSLAALAENDAPRVLIGGLGMGFTLRAALAVLGPGAKVTVAELVPGVVQWARGATAELFGGSLDDSRVQVSIGDVGDLISAARAGYEAILLDVDNGPDGITHQGNDRLYSAAGLRAAINALSPGGVLAIWSSAGDEAFTRRLKAVGFRVEVKTVRSGAGGKGARHTIWLGFRPVAAGAGGGARRNKSGR